MRGCYSPYMAGVLTAIRNVENRVMKICLIPVKNIDIQF